MCAYAREIRVALAGFERSDVRQPCKAVWQDGEERRQMRRRSPAKGHMTGHYATNGRSGSNWNSHKAQGIGGFRGRGPPWA